MEVLYLSFFFFFLFICITFVAEFRVIVFLLMDQFYFFIFVVGLIGVIVFVSLYFVDAGYGKMISDKWGPAINNKVGWMLMECPVFFMMIFMWGSSSVRFSLPYIVFFLMFELHYFQRSLVFPFRLKGQSRMPVVIMLMGILLSIVALFCLAGIYFFVKGYKNGMVVKLIRFVSRIPGCRKWGKKFSENYADDLKKIDGQIAGLHKQNKKYFFISFFLEYIGRILQSFEIFFMLMLFADQEPGVMLFVQSLIILAFTSLFANLLFFIPLQLGGREGGFAMVVSNLGMTIQVSMSISIISRVREIFWTSLGLLLMKVGNKSVEVPQHEEYTDS